MQWMPNAVLQFVNRCGVRQSIEIFNLAFFKLMPYPDIFWSTFSWFWIMQRGFKRYFIKNVSGILLKWYEWNHCFQFSKFIATSPKGLWAKVWSWRNLSVRTSEMEYKKNTISLLEPDSTVRPMRFWFHPPELDPAKKSTHWWRRCT